jgi:gliding motility-associated-like protein
MKKLLLFIFYSFLISTAFARHITGGEIIYDHLNSTASSKNYRVTLRLFRDAQNCTPAQQCADMPVSVVIGIYDLDNGALVRYVTVSRTEYITNLPVVSVPSCIENQPVFQYEAALFPFEIDLPNNNQGYMISYQTCCRVNGIANGGSNQGATYSTEIPGSNQLLNAMVDNSARFETGISVICFNQTFQLNFSATDPDADELVYSFANAFNGGSATGAAYNTPQNGPYSSIGYVGGFSGDQPLGPLATINPSTGIISGTAPGAGKYVVSVVVQSFRSGALINEHRKDFIVTVAPCNAVSAELKPTYTFCDFGVNNALTYSFQNESNSPLNLTFDWDFGDPASGASNLSTNEFPSHTFSAPGDYVLTLVVNKGQACERTATAIVKVYPGFFPTFPPVDTSCKNTPVNFTSAGTLNHGVFNYWKWDFGVTTLTNDTSRLQNTTYTYAASGSYNASVIVKSSRGCVDTLYNTVIITDSANLRISRDTLICAIDTLRLTSNQTTGTITWSPNTAIDNVNSFNPLVSPDVTTTYTATFVSTTGCTATKKVTVNVVNEVSLLAINDTTICRTDTARLNLNTDALYFIWTAPGNPPGVILNPTIKSPLVVPTNPVTIFNVRASISNKCFKDKSIEVRTVPYPSVNITGDTLICYGDNANLLATGGSSYTWSPISFLNNANIPNPTSVFPTRTTTYTVRVTDTFGCPKPVFKTFKVNVARIIADAGPQDTSIVLEQPLQLTATGSTNFLWTPSTSLTNANIFNPIATPSNTIKYTVEVSNSIGCKDTDTILVKVFFLPPDIYVPSAFSPDNNGSNETFKPIPLGIKQLDNFSVYTRWGERVFTTSKIGLGWDGTFKGAKQNPGTYLWQATAVDYKNKKVFRKGTVILIR